MRGEERGIAAIIIVAIVVVAVVSVVAGVGLYAATRGGGNTGGNGRGVGVWVPVYPGAQVLASYSTGAGGGTHGRSPIAIHSDYQFTSAKGVVSGSGTQADPYVIENWVIKGSSANGIEIENTTKCFVIRNCLVEGCGHSIKASVWHYAGIHLHNVINGKIENNICEDDSYFGIYLDSSSNNILLNNACLDGQGGGIYLVSSSNNTLTNNICNSNWTAMAGFGIEGGSNNNWIENNTARDIILDFDTEWNIMTGNHFGSYKDYSPYNRRN